jgi:hypothetical protein
MYDTEKKIAGMPFFHVLCIVFLKAAAVDKMSVYAVLLTFTLITGYICYA